VGLQWARQLEVAMGCFDSAVETRRNAPLTRSWPLQDSPMHRDAKTALQGAKSVSPDKAASGLAAQCSPGLAAGVLV